MIEEKYNIIYVKSKRYYKIDLSVRSVDFEYSTPYLLKVDDYEIKEASWNRLILKLAEFLNKYNPKTKESLLTIKNDWGKQAVFSTQQKSNFKEFDYGLFINVNHTSVHAVWTIQLLLSEWGINLAECQLYIHRQPRGEIAEVINYYTEKNLIQFKEYMGFATSMQPEQIDKVITLLKTINNKLCPKIFSRSGYNNIFVLDEYLFYDKMRKDMMIYINNHYVDKPIFRNNCNKSLNYLGKFYKQILR